ncbi:uncharacterized protein PADG_07940 [Paracoccidioides brasiliensis Pb18]|uniref:Uncharacterized protein n=1 Tax=Paracoccidioides brasiliensis (strain Pb18) TaxID=502780 RepID=C1GKT3_PARBD|nr:uncharacterized protein PADG_07940 [Paracoccidioides brasiliensis Pb18]EEH43120.2 hypothetical protein PADG_07940 [Paracoccidioides brasiliensis Pb18]
MGDHLVYGIYKEFFTDSTQVLEKKGAGWDKSHDLSGLMFVLQFGQQHASFSERNQAKREKKEKRTALERT